MNRGVMAGLKRLFVPASLGGGDSTNDGLALVLDSTQEGGVRPSQSRLTSAVALIVRAITGQTADLQQWQNSSSGVVCYVAPSGAIGTNRGISADSAAIPITLTGTQSAKFSHNGATGEALIVSRPGGGQLELGSLYGEPKITTISSTNPLVISALGNGVRIDSGAIGSVPLTVKGIVSQTADLLQLQNSALTALARIDKNGKPAFSEAANGSQGKITLVAGTATVNNTNVTANSRILLTAQVLGTVAIPTALAVTARTAGTSFTITSASATDTSDVAYLILEPA